MEEEQKEREAVAAVSKLLGVELKSWPYSDDTLRAMVELKTEQERKDTEKLKEHNLLMMTELLGRAEAAGIPPEAIPQFLGQALTSIPQIQTQRQMQAQAQLQLQPTSTPLRSPSISVTGPQGPILVPGSAMVSQMGQVPSQPPPGGQLQMQMSSPVRGSPVRAMHRRSHTISGAGGATSGAGGATSVWKVNLPQQHHYQFHHWPGPLQDGPPGTAGMIGMHSRAPSELRIKEEDPDTSEVSIASTKRKVSDSDPPFTSGHSHTESLSHKRTRSTNSIQQPTLGAPLGSPYIFRTNKQGSPARSLRYQAPQYYYAPPYHLPQQTYRFPRDEKDPKRPKEKEKDNSALNEKRTPVRKVSAAPRGN